MPQIVFVLWPIAVAFVTFLVWLIRLESRSIENSKEIKRLWNQRKEDLEAAKAARDQTNTILQEIQKDIKSLIAKVGS
jgi:hypothetical protein